MSDRNVPPIARVRLARSLPRLVAGPLLVGVAGALAGAAGWVTGGLAAIALGTVGGLLVALAVLGLLTLLTIRLDVEEEGLTLRWLGDARMYPLARGPVTRVALRGPNASKLKPRLGAFGWAVGPATLRAEEAIEVVRLAPTSTAILVPTSRGRLAIAAVAEEDLLRALGTAARARQRLEELARRAEPIAGPDDEEDEAEPARTLRLLTGVERSVIEERLVALRADAASAAEAAAEERRKAEAAAAEEAARLRWEAERPRTLRERLTPRRPAWLHRPRPGARAVLVVLPLAVAAGLAAAADLAGLLPLDDPGRSRPIALALALGGPVTTIAALVARIWWPRLVGVVAISGLAALALVARLLAGTLN